MAKIDLYFKNETGFSVSDGVFFEVFGHALKILKSEIFNICEGTVSVVIVDDKKIRTLNAKYRKIDKPTDVLSFPYLEKGLVGDILISYDTAARQAREHEHSVKRELKTLFTHGLLHLFGFDHRNDKEEKKMEGFAKKILES